MRVWAFPSFYPYDYPGLTNTGIFAHRQYKGLIQNGAELTVIVPVPWSPPAPFASLHPEWKKYQEMGYPYKRIYDGITVYHPRIANMKPSRFVKKTYAERFVDAIVKFFKDHKIKPDPKTDIFYSQWLPGSVLAQLAAHRLGVKSAVLSIGDDVALWPNSSEGNLKQFKQLLEDADLRFACADYLGKQANKLTGKDLPYTVVGWGVDHGFFKPVTAAEKNALRQKYAIPEDKVVILNVGTGGVRKGWLDLMDALVTVKKNNAYFVLIAVHAGIPEFDFPHEAEKRGLKDNYLDLPNQPPEALDKIYNMADIFCLPSHAEGMANVVLEAMSSGVATITTTVGGHPEAIDSGVNGILVSPQQPVELAEKLLYLVNDSNARAKLGTAAREFIIKKWGNNTDKAKVLYEKFDLTLK